MVEYIKICGIKRVEDALLSVSLGANAIGVIVGARHKTEDEISPEQAYEIFGSIEETYGDKGIYRVLVTHLTDPDEVYKIARRIRANAIQIHSDMLFHHILHLREVFRGLLIGVAHGNSDDVFIRVDLLVETRATDMILIDTKTHDRVGGTGITHDWNITKRLIETHPKTPFILAGGLSPENVVTAIKTVRPYGVDVNSGVKGKDGYKDPEKLKAFIESALRLQ